jgi:hypothetical protein
VRGLATIWNAEFSGRSLRVVRLGFQEMIGITLAGTSFRAVMPNSGVTRSAAADNMTEAPALAAATLP